MGSLVGLLGALLTLAGAAHAQAPPASAAAAALDIPDSLVIPGRAVYQQVTEGVKHFTYYGKAFPQERADRRHGTTSITRLPALESKDVYPTAVRHGGVRATTVEAATQHYGDLSMTGRHAAEWKGWLASVDGDLGGGLGHTTGAGWHREELTGRGRRVLAWHSGVDGGVRLQNGRTGAWGTDPRSHRDYYRLGLSAGGDRVLDGNVLRLDVDLQQRGVAGPGVDASEQAMRAGVHWERTNGRFWLRGQATTDFVWTSRDQGIEGTGSMTVIGAEAWTRPEENFGGGLGVNVYTTDPLDGDSLRTIRPSVTAWARMFRMLKLTATLTSSVERFGVWEAYSQNTTLDVATPLRMPFRSVDLDLNGEIAFTEWNVVTFGFRELIIKDYPIWHRPAPDQAFVLDYAYAGDQTASLSAVYGRYKRSWRHGSLDALAVWRTHALQGQPVPYVPDWELHVVTTVPWRWGRILSPTVRVVGPRSYVVPGNSTQLDRLDSFVQVDLRASMPLRRGWRISGSVQNLLHQNCRRWDGVNEPGLHLQIGAHRAW